MAALPTLPLGSTLTPRLIDWNGNLTPPLGGDSQIIRRLGARYEVQVTIPALDGTDSCAGDWVGAQVRSKTRGETLVLALPQLSGPGLAASVSVAAQGGDELAVSGVTKAVSAATLFSFQAGGRNYLHMVTDAADVGVGGFYIGPILRASPPTGPLEFDAPKLEGFLTDPKVEWTIALLRFVGVTFTLRENR